MTLEEIGQKYHLTRERVRQIEATTLLKIRRSKHIKELAVYTMNPEQSLQNIEEFREKYSETKNRYKAFFKDDGRTKERNSEENMRKLQTIYEYFNDYTKEQIDEMLKKLPDEDKELLRLRYGEDLAHPVLGKLSKEQTNKFYSSLVPRMKRLLANPSMVVRHRKPKSRDNEVLTPIVNPETIARKRNIRRKITN